MKINYMAFSNIQNQKAIFSVSENHFEFALPTPHPLIFGP